MEDSDLDLKETALRETHEEIGIHPEKIMNSAIFLRFIFRLAIF